MKAHELLKHLEDGGFIRLKKSGNVLGVHNLQGWDYDPIRNPEDYEIIKQNKDDTAFNILFLVLILTALSVPGVILLFSLK